MKIKISLLFILAFIMTKAQTFTNYTVDEGLIEGYIAAGSQDINGVYWFGSWSTDAIPAIASFDGATFQQYGIGDGPSSDGYRSIFSSSDGKIWFGSYLTGNGLDVNDNGSWINYTTDDGLAGNDIAAIFEDSNGGIWIGTLDGTSLFDGVNFTNYTMDDGMSVFDIIEDDQGNVWFGTVGNGVSVFDGTSFIAHYTMEDGLMSNSIYELYQNTTGEFYFGTYSDDIGVGVFDGTTFSVLTVEDGLIDDQVRAIKGSADGTVYFGTNAGVAIYKDGVFTSITEEDGLLQNNVRDIFIDADDNVVIGTWGGVSFYNPTLGIVDAFRSNFTISPNPASDIITINANGFEMETLNVYNVLGSLVREQGISVHTTQVSVQDLSSGIYLLKFSNSDGDAVVKKIIKE
ncbi:MAG: ligand-binding sensor domain-containing protein [Patiriisocius sp.]|jgi:ligand-binding sensor domain-containing protein